MSLVRQWDIVRFRIQANDRDLHPGIVISGEEWCADSQRSRINVLACGKRGPGVPVGPAQVALNGADGLEFATVVDCRFLHIITKESIDATIGRVSPERRRAVGRKINETLRLSL